MVKRAFRMVIAKAFDLRRLGIDIVYLTAFGTTTTACQSLHQLIGRDVHLDRQYLFALFFRQFLKLLGLDRGPRITVKNKCSGRVAF